MYDTRVFKPNQIRFSTEIQEPKIFRQGRWSFYEEPNPVSHLLCGKEWLLRPGITFTPYANPTPCNAHCAFCSEELLRKDGTHLTAKKIIGDHDQYFEGLQQFLTDIAGFPLGLSLSGLEATADKRWFMRLMDVLKNNSEVFAEKVLYTNGTGLAKDVELIDALVEVGFDRIELSRCSFDEKRNQKIMRFNRTEPVLRSAVFFSLLESLRDRIHTKLSCILTLGGTSSVEQVERYIEEAREYGVEEIVFRELSQLGDAYHINRFVSWIEENRVCVRQLMAQIHPKSQILRTGWDFVGATSGYYYYNEMYLYRNVRVKMETSSYIAHQNAQKSGVLHKLVLHSNGDLCGDWVPNSNIIGNYFQCL